MSLTIRKEQQSIIVTLLDLTADLTSIQKELSSDFRHIILDLSKFSTVSEERFQKFTNFGKTAAQNGSFVILCQLEYLDDFLIVPTLQEAFDVIEMEEIERQLDFEL